MKRYLNGKYAYLVIFLLAFAQYANTIMHDFAWDDAIVIVENTRVQKGLTDVPELFENISANKTEFRYGYRPITLLTFATEVQLFGVNPHVSHCTNVVLYALLCCLLLFFLNRFFPDKGYLMLAVVALFAVHPLHTEVVANIKSRDEILSLLFGMGAVWSFHGYVTRDKLVYLLASALLMLLAFLSKESAVTLIGIALLVSYYAYSKKGTRWWFQLLGLVSVLLILLALRAYVFSDQFFQTNAVELQDKGVFHYDVFLGNPLVDVTNRFQFFGNSMFLIVRYLKQFFVPLPLLHDYGYHQLKISTLQSPALYFSIVVVGLILIWMVWELRKRTITGFGLAFFFITISIYMHIVELAPDMYAERFMFTPLLGLCLAAGDLTLRIPFLKRSVPWMFAGVLIIFFALTFNRNKAWKDNDTLYDTDMPHLQKCARALYNYALFNHGKYYTASDELKPMYRDRAIEYYEKTIEQTDRLFIVYMDLGGAYMEFDRPKRALKLFKTAAIKFPHLSIPHVQIGKYHMSFKEYDKAIPSFEKAIELGEKNSDFYYLLAICLFNSDREQEAIDRLLAGEEQGTSSSAYYSLFARLYVKLDQRQKAIEAVERGLIVYPHDPGLQSILAQLHTDID